MATTETAGRAPGMWERVGGLSFRFLGSAPGDVRLDASRRNTLEHGRCMMWVIELSRPAVDGDERAVEEIARVRKRGAAEARMREWMREHAEAPHQRGE